MSHRQQTLPMDAMVQQLVGDLESRYAAEVERRDEAILDLRRQLAILGEGGGPSSREVEELRRDLAHQREENAHQTHQLRDLEARLSAEHGERAALKAKLERFNTDVNVSVQISREKDDQIQNLRTQLAKTEARTAQQRQDTLRDLAEKKTLADAKRHLESHIRDLDSAVQELMGRNEELCESIKQLHIQLDEAREAYTDEQTQNAELESAIRRLRDGVSAPVPTAVEHASFQSDALDVVGLRQDLIVAKNQVTILEGQVARLNEVEARLAQLTVTLEHRTKQNQVLEDLCEQRDTELVQAKRALELYGRQVSEYDAKLEFAAQTSEQQIREITEGMKIYAEREARALTRLSELEGTNFDLANKLRVAEDRANQLESGTFGLPEAFGQIKQLTTMVTLRDAQIGDLVQEVNMLHRVVGLLERELPASFDSEAFFNRLAQDEVDDVLQKSQQRALNLIERALENRQNVGIGNVQIVLGAGANERTIVVGTEDGRIGPPKQLTISAVPPTPLLPPPPQTRSFQSLSELPGVQAGRGASREFRREKALLEERLTERDAELAAARSEVIGLRRENERLQKVSQIPMLPLYRVTNPAPMPMTMPGVDSESQTEQPAFDEPLRASSPHGIVTVAEGTSPRGSARFMDSGSGRAASAGGLASGDDHSDVIRELRRNVELYRRERNDLQRKVSVYKADSESTRFEVERLRALLEAARAGRPHESDESGGSSARSARSIRRANSPRSAEALPSPRSTSAPLPPLRLPTVDVDVQTDNDRPRLEVVPGPHTAVCVPEPVLELSHVDEGVPCTPPALTFLFLIEPYQRPNEEERQVFLARQEAVRVEYDALQKTVTENEHVYAEQASSLERSQQIIAEMEGTISRLEQELAEQRNTFRERLLEYRTEAERYVTTVKTEVEDAGRAARNVSPVKEHDVDLEQVSQRLQMLNMSKASLTQELEDARESVKLTERRNRQLRARVSELEAQQKESEDKLNQTQRTRSVRDHTFQLKGKYTALKTKYQELETQYTQLRHSRLSRFDPLMQQRQMSPRRDNELDELNAQKARISETRIEVLRGRVEEMQVLLEKATGTIERLNQLVSRKETQLTHFHQQIAELKQELASRS